MTPEDLEAARAHSMKEPGAPGLAQLSEAARRAQPLWPAATLALVQEVLNRRLFSVVRGELRGARLEHAPPPTPCSSNILHPIHHLPTPHPTVLVSTRAQAAHLRCELPAHCVRPSQRRLVARDGHRLAGQGVYGTLHAQLRRLLLPHRPTDPPIPADPTTQRPNDLTTQRPNDPTTQRPNDPTTQ